MTLEVHAEAEKAVRPARDFTPRADEKFFAVYENNV
jgi:hypothetical protein